MRARHRADEALRLQRRPHRPLPERPALLRPLRRARPVRDRRGQRRDPRPPGALWPRTRATRRRSSSGSPHGRCATGTTRASSSGRSATSAGYGAAHDAMAAWIRRMDPSRSVHYEGGDRAPGWRPSPASGAAVTDVVCPMYPSIDDLVAWARAGDDRRPLILCEYSHAMGNSQRQPRRLLGRHRATPGLQGGFVWDWFDQGLVLDDAGRHRLRLRRRLRRRAQRRGLLPQRAGRPRPHAAPGLRARKLAQPLEVDALRPARGPLPAPQPAGLHRPERPRRLLDPDRRRRTGGRGSDPPAGDPAAGTGETEVPISARRPSGRASAATCS